MIKALEFPPDTYNLAPTTLTSVDDIAQIVIEEMGLRNVTLKHTPVPKYDVPIVKLDIQKITNKTGWFARHTSSETIRIATKRILEELN